MSTRIDLPSADKEKIAAKFGASEPAAFKPAAFKPAAFKVAGSDNVEISVLAPMVGNRLPGQSWRFIGLLSDSGVQAILA